MWRLLSAEGLVVHTPHGHRRVMTEKIDHLAGLSDRLTSYAASHHPAHGISCHTSIPSSSAVR